MRNVPTLEFVDPNQLGVSLSHTQFFKCIQMLAHTMLCTHIVGGDSYNRFTGDVNSIQCAADTTRTAVLRLLSSLVPVPVGCIQTSGKRPGIADCAE